jgi:predicted choloylglycine hydrolase
MKEYTSISSLFSNEILLINVEENFKDWHINYPNGYNQLQSIFKALLPSIKKLIEFDEKGKKNKVNHYLVDDA